MKVKVIVAFNDRKANMVTREVGKTFTCDDDRAKELIDKGFVEEVVQKEAKAPAEKPKKAAKKSAPAKKAEKED